MKKDIFRVLASLTIVSQFMFVSAPLISAEEITPDESVVVESQTNDTVVTSDVITDVTTDVTTDATPDAVTEVAAPIEETAPAETAPVIFPELTTDKADYLVGEIATIFGRFFQSLQNIILKIFGGTVEEGTYTETAQDITTDDQGSFTTTYTLDNIFRPTYTVTAENSLGELLAQTTFTDPPSKCSNLGGSCCSAGYFCTSGQIPGATDCDQCCGSVANCQIPSPTGIGLTPLEIDADSADAALTSLPDDWDSVIGSSCTTDSPGNHAAQATCIIDPLNGDTGFTGGGSKDDLDINRWAWSAASGEQTPPKDNIGNAFAAVYNYGGDQILYFGIDRLREGGSAQVGFWFLQEKIGLGASGNFVDSSNAPAYHTDGDILVQANFSNGGNISTLSVWKWQSGALVSISETSPGTNIACNPAGTIPAGSVCVAVNTSNMTPAWLSPTALTGQEFFEGGINLTDLGLAGSSCISQFIGETRSSTPFNAVLKDFVFGDLSTCGTLTIVKNAVPDNAQDFAFTTTGTGLSNFSLDDDLDSTLLNTKTFSGLVPGIFSVTETPVTNWDQTSAICSDGSPVSAISIQASESITCTFTNTKQPTLTVNKVLVPSADSGKFNLKIDSTIYATDVGNGGSTGAQIVSIGSHTVSEAAGAGTSLSDYVTVISGNCATDGTVSLAAGDNKTCTITNTRKGTIIIEKQTDPDQTAGSFTFTGDAAGTISDGGQITVSNLVPGTYTSTENNPSPTFALTSIVCDDGSSVTPSTVNVENRTATFNVDPSETVKCTFTNTLQTGTLVVKKHVINNNGGSLTASNFTLHVKSGEVDVAGSPAAGSESGTTYTLNTGTYAVSENTPPTGYTNVTNDTNNDDCDASGNVTVVAGQTKYCTITNDDIAPKLTVTKIVVNDNGGNAVVADFPLFVNGNSVTSGVQNTLSANVLYTATETPLTGYAASVWGGDCATDGTITLNEGDVKACTITNDDIAPKLTVTKIVVNDNGGNAVVADFPLFVNGNSVTSGVQNGFDADTYIVSETQQTGYAATISGDCDSTTGSITLSVGDNKTCTITNDDIQPTLTLVKTVINNNGGTLGVANFPLFVDQTPVTSGVANGLNAGSYTASETTQYGYAASVWGTDCAEGGLVTLSVGDNKTCTITNDDIAPKLTIVKNADPNDCQDFTFSMTGQSNFLLDDNEGVQDCIDTNQPQSKTFDNLIASQNINVTEALPNQYWKFNGVTCVITDTQTPYTFTGITNGMTINLNLADDVTCTFANEKLSPTRTQGFWQTHTAYTSIVFTNNLSQMFIGVNSPVVLGSHKGQLTTTGQLFGAFYSNIAKTTTKANRSALDKARMQLLQQLVAAKLNCAAFGCSASVQLMITAADTAYAGTSASAILASASLLDGYNNSGDTIIIGSAGSATPKISQSTANLIFWDLP